MTLSPALWPLLDLLQFRFGVSIEVYDAALRPMQAEPTGRSMGSIEDPAIRERCLAVLTAAEPRAARTVDPSVAVFPLRRGRENEGVIIVTPNRTVRAERRAEEPLSLDMAGQIARAVLETDLALSTDLARANERTRRLQGILRFLGVLAARESEEEIMRAVVQAATVWFDLDCRIYRREPDDSYSLFAALPGMEGHEIKERLDGSRLREVARRGRLSSTTELEEFGWPARRGEALVLTLGPGPDWVMLIAGVFDSEVELTFGAIAHVLGAQLQQTAARRAEHWRDRLFAEGARALVTPERLLQVMVEELTAAVGATAARLSMTRNGEERTLAQTGKLPVSKKAAETAASEQPYRVTFPVAAGSQAHLEVWGGVSGFEALASVDAWVEAVTPWLSGVVVGMMALPAAAEGRADAEAFERRIQDEVERAKRFNLGLGLVVIAVERKAKAREAASSEALFDLVRPELRASDLLGRVRGGLPAILLVHAGTEGAQSVAERLRQRLASQLGVAQKVAIRLGQAVFSPECASADALIRHALGDLEQSQANG